MAGDDPGVHAVGTIVFVEGCRMTGPTIVRKVTFSREAKGRKRLRDKRIEPVVVKGERIPRRTQLLALALKFEEMLASGEVQSYAEIAEIAGVSRARVSQIMGSLNLSQQEKEDSLLRLSS